MSERTHASLVSGLAYSAEAWLSLFTFQPTGCENRRTLKVDEIKHYKHHRQSKTHFTILMTQIC